MTPAIDAIWPPLLLGALSGVLVSALAWVFVIEPRYRKQLTAVFVESTSSEVADLAKQFAMELVEKVVPELVEESIADYRANVIGAVEQLQGEVKNVVENASARLDHEILKWSMNMALATDGAFRSIIVETLEKRGVVIAAKDLDELAIELTKRMVDRAMLFKAADDVLRPKKQQDGDGAGGATG